MRTILSSQIADFEEEDGRGTKGGVEIQEQSDTTRVCAPELCSFPLARAQDRYNCYFFFSFCLQQTLTTSYHELCHPPSLLDEVDCLATLRLAPPPIAEAPRCRDTR